MAAPYHTEKSDLSIATAIPGFHLEVVEGPEEGKRWESSGERCTIGFHESCDLVIADRSVSRFHCELQAADTRVRLRDLRSRNGCYIDGIRIIDGFLRPGSVIRLGRSRLRFQYSETNPRVPLSSRAEFGVLRGRSVVMRRMFALLERAAASSVTILLQGETGTGKSAAARSIHMESPRKDGPFILIDCSTLPGNLLESELFGHEKGAFTGAQSARVGAFEEARGGTIFLDELGELPIELQAKLLSVLENREIRPLGSNRSRPVDVRVIAATNRDLRGEVNARRFREDLYYRLSVVDIEIPPLRQRLDDIAEIAQSLLRGMELDDEQIAEIANSELFKRLRASTWPGNIRELRNHLERYLLFRDFEEPGGPGRAHGSDRAIDDTIDHAADETRSRRIEVDDSLPFSDSRQKAIAEFERVYVAQLLEHADGNVAAAARKAGITRTYLYRLVQRHKLATR